MTSRAYYSDLIEDFLARDSDNILGALSRGGSFSLDATQRDAWIEQIKILHSSLTQYKGKGKIYFEYSVPRLGKRIDTVLVIDSVVFVIEFKVGEKEFTAAASDQVWDYAVDLKNFHETSHDRPIAPVLIATRATNSSFIVSSTSHDDGVLHPIYATTETLHEVINSVLIFCEGPSINADQWDKGRYCPTPQ